MSPLRQLELARHRYSGSGNTGAGWRRVASTEQSADRRQVRGSISAAMSSNDSA